jgi:predicted dinucleotide-binding enzyme
VGSIGSGAIGSTIARLAVEAGHQVVLSNSRGPETLADTAAELGPRAFAATSGEAAAAGDIVVIRVPVKAFPTLPAAPLAGKAVCSQARRLDVHTFRPGMSRQPKELTFSHRRGPAPRRRRHAYSASLSNG